MKVECLREKLAQIVSKAEKVTSKNSTLPVLKCILIEAGENLLTVRATNLDLGIEISIPAKVTEPGKVAVPGAILNSFLSRLSNEKGVTLTVVENNLHVSSLKSSTIIKTMPIEEYPVIPRIESPSGFNINVQDFITGLKSVQYSCATSTIKPEISSVKVYTEDNQIIFAATDGFRLAEKKINSKKTPEFSPVLIPVKNVNEIVRVLDGTESEISILVDKNQLAIMTDDFYLVSRTVEGNFPNYKAIFPKEFVSEATFLKQDLINSLKLSTIFTDAFNHIKLTLRPEEKQIEVITKNNDIGENSSTINAVVKGTHLDLNFNFKYISDALQSLSGDSLVFKFSGPTTPLLIKSTDDDTFTYVVMPMNR